MNRRLSVPSLWVPVLLLATLSLAVTVAVAEDQRLVSDDVYTWGDLGGIVLTHSGCDGSLDGRAIDGFDMPGEWIAWHLTLTEPFCFVDSLRTAGRKDDVRHFRTEFILDPTMETASQDTVLTTPGLGLT